MYQQEYPQFFRRNDIIFLCKITCLCLSIPTYSGLVFMFRSFEISAMKTKLSTGSFVRTDSVGNDGTDSAGVARIGEQQW